MSPESGARGERAEWVVLEDTAISPDEVGEMRNNAGDFQFKDQHGTFNPRSGGGGGITEGQHEVLDTLVHEIDETSYDEVAYSGSNPTSYIVWETAAKLKKIREETYSYSSGKVSQIVTKQYDGAGTLKMTMTEVYTYSGSKVTSVARTKS